MTPAKERLKKVADRLSEDEAAVVLRVARELQGAGRESAKRLRDLEDRADARLATEALADPERIPYEAVRRQRRC